MGKEAAGTALGSPESPVGGTACSSAETWPGLELLAAQVTHVRPGDHGGNLDLAIPDSHVVMALVQLLCGAAGQQV